MNAPARTFEAKPAVRASVPLLVGLMGCSGAGKTYSALRLATGIQKVTGGAIHVIDTEARRSLHYADQFTFKHVEFAPPFGSLDYLSAIRHQVAAGAGVVVVDSMSHEHEGPGGMLDLHDQELDRMAGNDWSKRERVNMLAWQKPKANRRHLINGLLQLNANFVFCFRAKNTVKPVRVQGKTEIVPQGFMPIAGDEFLFEQTLNCLLLPNSKGVPTWQSENMGERQMIKLPRHFEKYFAEAKPLDEGLGQALAEWARGGQPMPTQVRESSAERSNAVETVSPPAADQPAGASAFPAPAGIPTWQEYVDQWDAMLHEDSASAEQLHQIWSSKRHKDIRSKITWDDGVFDTLKARVTTKIAALKGSPGQE